MTTVTFLRINVQPAKRTEYVARDVLKQGCCGNDPGSVGYSCSYPENVVQRGVIPTEYRCGLSDENGTVPDCPPVVLRTNWSARAEEDSMVKQTV